MGKKRDEAAFWQDVKDALQGVDAPDFTDEGYSFQWGFQIARLIQGVLVKHGYNPRKTNVEVFRQEVIETAEDDMCSDPEEVYEAFFDAWGRVRIPGGVNAYKYAAEGVTGETRLEGTFPTTRRQLLAARVFEMARRLILMSTEGVFGIACEQTAAALGVARMDAWRALDDLVRTGYLERVGRPIPHRKAQAYRLGPKASDT